MSGTSVKISGAYVPVTDVHIKQAGTYSGNCYRLFQKQNGVYVKIYENTDNGPLVKSIESYNGNVAGRYRPFFLTIGARGYTPSAYTWRAYIRDTDETLFSGNCSIRSSRFVPSDCPNSGASWHTTEGSNAFWVDIGASVLLNSADQTIPYLWSLKIYYGGQAIASLNKYSWSISVAGPGF